MILIGHDGHLGNSFIIGTTIFKCRINFFQMIFIFMMKEKKLFQQQQQQYVVSKLLSCNLPSTLRQADYIVEGKPALLGLMRKKRNLVKQFVLSQVGSIWIIIFIHN